MHSRKYQGKHDGFDFSHFLENLAEDEGIRLTYPVLSRIMC